MFVPTLVYSFFLFLKLAVRLGLTADLVAAWPMWLGVAIGTQLVMADAILSEYIRLYQNDNDFKIVLERARSRLAAGAAGENLATQNVIFAAGWAAVALFGMTSTIGPPGGEASWLGKGVVLGVGLQLAVRVAKDLFDWSKLNKSLTFANLNGQLKKCLTFAEVNGKRQTFVTPEKLNWFFSPIKRQLPPNEIAAAGLAFLTIFIVLSSL